MARYYGGKNHLFQRIINLIPEHERWVEAFGGSAAVSRRLARRGAEGWVLELDQAQARRLRVELPGHRVLCCDAIAFLREHGRAWGPETVVFADPPYPLADRRDSRARYRCELQDDQHHELAELLHETRARVLVCGHPWGLYPRLFRAWQRHEFPVTLRSGKPGVECIWTNYDDPFPLHDYRYWGENKRVRQDLRRQVSRQLAKFNAMEKHQRAAVLRALVEQLDGGRHARLRLLEDPTARTPAVDVEDLSWVEALGGAAADGAPAFDGRRRKADPPPRTWKVVPPAAAADPLWSATGDLFPGEARAEAGAPARPGVAP